MADQDDICVATVYKGGFHTYRCTRRGIISRDGKRYCRQHDPQARAERDANERALRLDKQKRATATDLEGQRLLRLLDVGGCTYYHFDHRADRSGVCEAVVISFDDARRLIERLKEGSKGEGV